MSISELSPSRLFYLRRLRNRFGAKLFDAKRVAFVLGVTPRAARYILGDMCQAGVAELVDARPRNRLYRLR